MAVAAEAERAARVGERARRPDPVREGSVVTEAGRAPVADFLAGLGCESEAVAPRAPVIGYGSNRAPVQIARKFGARGDWAVPVTAVFRVAAVLLMMI